MYGFLKAPTSPPLLNPAHCDAIATWRSSVDENLVKDLHKGICRYYVEYYGLSIGKLPEWTFHFVEAATLKEIREAIEKYDIDNIDGNTLADAFDELVAKGFLKRLDWGFNLTEEGLRAGTRNVFSTILLFLNKNSGISILVSAIALVVSIAALLISVNKP